MKRKSSVKWVEFTKRTDDPKLCWIQKQLDKAGIPNRRAGFSFHGPRLEVDVQHGDAAGEILVRKMGRVWVDDVRDDAPVFRNFYAANRQYCDARVNAADRAYEKLQVARGKLFAQKAKNRGAWPAHLPQPDED